MISGQHHVMIDTGGEGYGYDTGEGTLFPTLEKLGIKKIHGLYLTHLDADHCENAMELVKKFPVERVFLPPQENSPWFKEFLEICRQQKTAVDYPANGESHSWGSMTLTNYYLSLPGNDGSLVQEIKKGEHRFLFTGDAGFETERRLMNELSPVQVLKVGHHGSKESTGKEFLHRIQPKYGILSVGRKNSYGHPHEDVLSRLEEAKVTVYRTDRQGCITWQETLQGKIYGQNEAGKEALKLWIMPLLYTALALGIGKGKEDENWL